MTIGEAHIVQVPYQEEEPFRARRTGRGAGPGARRQYSFQTRVSLFRVTAAAAHLVPFDGDIDPASATGESVVVVKLSDALTGQPAPLERLGVNQAIWDPAGSPRWASPPADPDTSPRCRRAPAACRSPDRWTSSSMCTFRQPRPAWGLAGRVVRSWLQCGQKRLFRDGRRAGVARDGGRPERHAPRRRTAHDDDGHPDGRHVHDSRGAGLGVRPGQRWEDRRMGTPLCVAALRHSGRRPHPR